VTRGGGASEAPRRFSFLRNSAELTLVDLPNPFALRGLSAVLGGVNRSLW
jgi:hypothetical protein